MNALLVIANPNPGSFNYALLDTVVEAFRQRQDAVRILDLYQSGFDPVLYGVDLAALQQGVVPEEVRTQQSVIEWADVLVFIYPLWWFDRPAILKGWCDRVLTQGFAFRYGPEGVEGRLSSKRAMVLVTAGGSEAEFAAMEMDDAAVLTPMLRGTLGFCGVEVMHSRLFHAVATASNEVRSGYLDETRQMILRLPLD